MLLKFKVSGTKHPALECLESPCHQSSSSANVDVHRKSDAELGKNSISDLQASIKTPQQIFVFQHLHLFLDDFTPLSVSLSVTASEKVFSDKMFPN